MNAPNVPARQLRAGGARRSLFASRFACGNCARAYNSVIHITLHEV
jgi:hypothetical protein